MCERYFGEHETDPFTDYQHTILDRALEASVYFYVYHIWPYSIFIGSKRIGKAWKRMGVYAQRYAWEFWRKRYSLTEQCGGEKSFVDWALAHDRSSHEILTKLR